MSKISKALLTTALAVIAGTALVLACRHWTPELKHDFTFEQLHGFFNNLAGLMIADAEGPSGVGLTPLNEAVYVSIISADEDNFIAIGLGEEFFIDGRPVNSEVRRLRIHMADFLRASHSDECADIMLNVGAVRFVMVLPTHGGTGPPGGVTDGTYVSREERQSHELWRLAVSGEPVPLDEFNDWNANWRASQNAEN